VAQTQEWENLKDWRQSLLGEFSGGSIARVLSFIFVAVTGFYFYAINKGAFGHLQILNEHFICSADGLQQGRFHSLVSHAFLWSGEYLQAGLMLFGLIYFASAAQRRIGTLCTLLVFVLSTALGGWLSVFSNTPAGETAWQGLIQSAAGLQEIGPYAVSALTVLFESFQLSMPTVSGPAACVTAFMFIAVMLRAPRESWKSNVTVLVAAMAYVVVDCLGLLRSGAPSISYALRVAGFAVALLFVPLCALRRAPHRAAVN
jgi:hypothetical protein